MAIDEADTKKVPPSVEAFVRQLVITSKAVALYPPSSSIPLEAAQAAETALHAALEECPEVSLDVVKQGLYFDGAPVLQSNLAAHQLCTDFYHRRLATVRFHAGATTSDIVTFLSVLKVSPEELVALGGYESQLWEQGVTAISVVETQVTLIDQKEPGEGDDDKREDGKRSTAVDLRGNAPRSRERIELARVAGDSRALSTYLIGKDGAYAHNPDIQEMARRFTELARMVAEQGASAEDSLTVAFGQALWTLAPDTRASLLETELLPSARKTEALGQLVRGMDLQDIMRMLAEKGVGEEFSATRTGFERAIRNLVQITHYDRTRVADAAEDALREVGTSETTIGRVVEGAVPDRLTVRKARAATMTDPAAEMALRLVDNAPLSLVRDGSSDPEIAALQEEAAHVVTDADIIAALVTLVGLDSREAQFANTMSALEDTLDTLVVRGQIATAADAARTLISAAKNANLTEGQRHRLEDAVNRFAKSDDIRTITHTLREHHPGEPEYDAAITLLDSLGVFAIRPLLEQLAQEQDRTERKALVDLLSKRGGTYLHELGGHVNDPRWFFVRNVMTILGATKSVDALGPLERGMRHPESRVRREAIRSVSAIHHPKAVTLLAMALGDDDAQNVQLAARYLGMLGSPESVQPLEVLARGEGKGNRDNGPRVEAIEALGRMGARDAVPTLQALARKRVFLQGARTKELRTAAESALANIKAKGGV